jgi:hypothetical protein
MILIAGSRVGNSHGRNIHDSKSLDRQGADLVQVHINIPAGKLTLAGGSTRLMEADFDYTESEGSPQVSYQITGKLGRLELTQPGRNTHVIGGIDSNSAGARNDWNVHLNNQVPLELTIEMNAGYSDLHLGQLAVTRIKLQTDASELHADFIGDWKKDLDALIQGGVGRTVLRLPKNTGVRVQVERGIGTLRAEGFRRDGDDYVNSAYGKSPVTLRLKIESSIGSITLLSAP